MSRRGLSWLVLTGLLSLGGLESSAAELRLGERHRFVFRPADQSRSILATPDQFTRRLSPFDRSARLKSDRPVDQATYLKFAAAQALDWTSEEQSALAAALEKVKDKLLTLQLRSLPPQIDLIKTTGAEEGRAAYTRGAAIILPQNTLGRPGPALEALLCHELFHVLSRHDQALRQRLYHTIGFEPCAELRLPEPLSQRRITNPDGPVSDYCIKIQVDGQEEWAIPILYSRSETYDPNQGGEFFDYMVFQFAIIDQRVVEGATRPKTDGGAVRLVNPQQAGGFFEQIGRNTKYIIHPDEVLADNFVLIATSQREIASPELLARIEQVLTARL